MKWRLARTTIDLERPQIMGIINITPDSFSGDGLDSVEAAWRQARRMRKDGAAIIDVGGESSRPGATPVSLELELSRVVPVVERLRQLPGMVISVDTVKPAVAEAVLAAGADIINDISGLGDTAMAEVIARHGAGVVIMHMQGTPATMQDRPLYTDVVDEVSEFFRWQIEAAIRAGIGADQIVLDPGIGFGKTQEHNLGLLRAISEFRATFDQPILVGASRKGFLGTITGRVVARERVAATTAVTALVVEAGANLVRVHDVAANHDALEVALALRG